MLNGTEITTVASTAGGAIVTVGAVLAGIYKWLNKRFPKEVAAAESKVPGAVKTAVEDAVKVFEWLAKSPLFASQVAAGKLEAKHVADKLLHTTSVSEAKTVLLTIGKAFNVLTPDEVVKAEVNLRLALTKLGITASEADIKDFFAEAQKAIDTLSNDPTFKATFPTETPATA